MRKYEQRKQEDFAIRQQVALSLQELFDTFYMDLGLQYLIDKGSEVIGHPLLVHDSSYKVLASSYEMRQALIIIENEDGDFYLKKEAIQFIQQQNAIGTIRKGGELGYIERPDSGGGVLAAMIKINGIEAAHLAVYESGSPFTDTDKQLIREFCKLISLELQRNNSFLMDKKLIPSHLLADLLEGQIINEEVIKHKLHSLQWDQWKDFYIMVIIDRKQKRLDSKIPVILQAMKPFLPINRSMVYNSYIIVFLNRELTDKLLLEKKTEFTEFIEANSLCAGISFRFDNFYECRKYYLQAVKSAEMAQKLDVQVIQFGDCALYIFSEMIQSQYDIMEFTHPAVLTLIQSDRDTDGDLLRTLELYIYYSNSPNKAANDLNIHRNTLFYRINKIKDMTGIKLENAEEILKIYLSIRLLEINGIIR